MYLFKIHSSISNYTWDFFAVKIEHVIKEVSTSKFIPYACLQYFEKLGIAAGKCVDAFDDIYNF